MAKLKNLVFGKVSGKLGPVVFRLVHGEQYLVQRPSSYTTSNSAAAIYSRNRLVSLVKFSSFLNKIDYIREFWDDNSLRGWSPYHKILNYNSPLLSGVFISPRNAIAPFTDPEPEISFTLSQNTLTFTLLDSVFDPIASRFRLDIVIVLTEPSEGVEQILSCFSLFREVTTSEISIAFELEDDITSRFKEYRQLIVFPLFSFEKEGTRRACSKKGTPFSLPLQV